MSDYFDAFAIKCDSATDERYTIVCGKVRISVLTDSLIRVERSKSGKFCDEPTQSVLCRNFGTPEFTSEIKGKSVTVTTKTVEFSYNASTGRTQFVMLADGRKVSDFTTGNLGGTTRTLDRSFGSVRLDDGIMSLNGVAVLDDSKSLIIADDGTIAERSNPECDRYFFAYNHDYRRALADFFKLTGKPPLVPRFTLGNWWSRYKAYTQDEYVTLMKRFIDEKIPITVATVDMDWHWVNLKEKFGNDAFTLKDSTSVTQRFYDAISKGGWTGYSWNTDLFPDYREFLKWLHANGFKVTLNLHPASGIRWFEDCYADFCDYMGEDPAQKKTFAFDFTDKKYIEGYFSIVHKPYENEGVDFWWIDWQQGNKSKIKGLDPLWTLNHYHSLDIARDGKRRPLILSRFAGAGSHRYPLGFSGDTAQNWDVLNFQPYFTATASNIGYTWWSHDIGGHHMGKKDDQLYLRWVQYGVFSPIMRLHSTSNEFMGKEPWKYAKPIEKLAVDALRFRHRLIPYIYSMNYRTHTEGRALVEPMYYQYPENKEAYDCRNEYLFGSELTVVPITSPVSPKTGMAGAKAWLPDGRFTDVFTGRIYNGGSITMFRDVSSIPVLAKQGAIIPLSLSDTTNDCSNPDALEILIYRGNNSFSMYEDDGESMEYENGAFAQTVFEVGEDGDTLKFTVNAASGDRSVIPQKRKYKLSFKDIVSCRSVSAVAGGLITDSFNAYTENGTLVIEFDGINCFDTLNVTLEGITVLRNVDKREALIECISKFRTGNSHKASVYNAYIDSKAPMPSVEDCFRGPLEEIEQLYIF